uniref:Uncharacterized protein n=1 Tax=Oryza brachyantha TaxID=4533 RepID=J3MQU3_ORYBR
MWPSGVCPLELIQSPCIYEELLSHFFLLQCSLGRFGDFFWSSSKEGTTSSTISSQFCLVYSVYS